MTMRLSMSALAGIARTEVAVGTSSESSMFLARSFAGPRRGVIVSSGAVFGAVSLTVTWGTDFVSAFRVSDSAEDGETPRRFSRAAGGADEAVAGASDFAAELSAGFAADLSAGFAAGLSAAFAAGLAAAVWEPPLFFSYLSKNGQQDLSTELLSDLYCSYNSSTSHSLDPKSSTVRFGVLTDTALIAYFLIQDLLLNDNSQPNAMCPAMCT